MNLIDYIPGFIRTNPVHTLILLIVIILAVVALQETLIVLQEIKDKESKR